jgi:hypothetical protein
LGHENHDDQTQLTKGVGVSGARLLTFAELRLLSPVGGHRLIPIRVAENTAKIQRTLLPRELLATPVGPHRAIDAAHTAQQQFENIRLFIIGQ